MQIADIKVGQRHRNGLGDIDSLAASIREIGLLNPINVTEDGRLIAGRRRLEACKQLGWDEVPTTIIDLDALGSELAEIDENLIRDDLTVLERSEHLARRKEIYETLHPETKAYSSEKQRNRRTQQPGEIISPGSFSADTASKTGVTSRTVQQEVQIASQIDSDVREAIRETPVADRKTDLLRLAQMKPDQQKAVSSKIASGEAKTVSQAVEGAENDRKKVRHAETHPVSDAAYYVDLAISQLERIRDDDPNADRELNRACEWIAGRRNGIWPGSRSQP